MRIATWNVNSITVRLPRLVSWLNDARPDVLCLQETKIDDARFPRAEVEATGYRVHFAGQRTYNGVALLVRDSLPDLTDRVDALPGFDDPQKRVLGGTIGALRVIGFYVPNGQSIDSDKYQYKLRWCAAATAFLKSELARHPELAVAGDFNIAPEDRDVHDPAAWAGQVLCSDPERAAFRGLIDLGMSDSFRLFPQADRSFTWWDYRMQGFRRKLGLRIDHILLSAPLVATCTGCRIEVALRALERPSDHAPVIADLA